LKKMLTGKGKGAYSEVARPTQKEPLMFPSAAARTSILQELGAVVKPDPDLPVALSEPQFLSDWSPRDKPWDVHKSQAVQVSSIFASDPDGLAVRHGQRVSACGESLVYRWATKRDDPSELAFKLQGAHFCHVRLCPVCQWRRAMMYLARFLEGLPKVTEENPTARWLFLTLTQRNVPIDELRAAIIAMNKAWDRLAKKKAFGAVRGWVRTTEVTRGSDGSAHPHFHVLLMVNANYFGKNYITQAAWAEMWRHALHADYEPIVHIQVVKDKESKEALVSAVRETLKYSVKPMDMTADHAWLLELKRQLHSLHFIATGGVLKGVLREGQETQQDLLLAGNEEIGVEVPTEEKPFVFDFDHPVKRYRKRVDSPKNQSK
jgi:plasmid rolling circle replication initiator protein Rep